MNVPERLPWGIFRDVRDLSPSHFSLEQADAWLAGALDGSPLLVALAIAIALGLRHASDPDHLVAVTSLVVAERRGARAPRAVRLGALWGLGHALTLIALGLPPIALKAELPAWLETGAEKAVGVVILVLAARVLAKWLRGDYRAGPHRHSRDVKHRHLRHEPHWDGDHVRVRSGRSAFGIGVLHGLAGTGAVVLLLIAALPGRAEATAALAIFAPASIVSMAVLSGGFAWALTRPVVEPLYRGVAIPALGAFSLLFGGWYVAAG